MRTPPPRALFGRPLSEFAKALAELATAEQARTHDLKITSKPMRGGKTMVTISDDRVVTVDYGKPFGSRRKLWRP